MIRKIIKDLITNNEPLFKAYSNLRFIFGSFRYLSSNIKQVGLFWKVKPYTLVSFERLYNVHMLSRLIEENSMKGAFVECGVWKGGCVAIMAHVAKKAGSNRKIWLFDSFEGLPEPTKKDGIEAKIFASKKDSGKLKSIKKVVASISDVNEILSKLKIDRKNIVIRKGWFQDTLPKAKKDIGAISILRLDADWYESTKICLEKLYGLIIPKGYIIIDDYYSWGGCRKAVDEFIAKNNLQIKIRRIDRCAAYFQKP